jgi:hypothetical protein
MSYHILLFQNLPHSTRPTSYEPQRDMEEAEDQP